MRKKLLRLSCLALILVLCFTSAASAFTFQDTSGMTNDELTKYRREAVESAKSIAPSNAEIQKMKPQTPEIKSVEARCNGYSGTYLGIKLEVLDGFEEYVEAISYPGYDIVKIYTSKTKDGPYEYYTDSVFFCDMNANSFDNGYALLSYSIPDGTYVKICFGYMGARAVDDICSKLSDPVQIPVQTVPVPNIDVYKISSTEIYVSYDKKSNYTRVLQVREKGTTAWKSVTKSSLVSSVKTNHLGYTLKVDSGKEYEFRARQYKTYNGKKYYSKYVTKKKYGNPNTKFSNVTFLRYDKNNGRSLIMQFSPSADEINGFQIAYRKAGTSKWSYDYTQTATSQVSFAQASSSAYQGFIYPAKYGYEYKVRHYFTEDGKKVKSTVWSKIYKCTNKACEFVNEAQQRDTTADHSYYDSRKSLIANQDILSREIFDAVLLRLYNDGIKENVEDYGRMAKLDYSRIDEGFIGVHNFGYNTFTGKAALLEMLCFYAGDNEVAYALTGWIDAIYTYNHANTDYFGFKDVKSTKNGFIIEMNGQQIEVEKVSDGRIFWFDVSDQ